MGNLLSAKKDEAWKQQNKEMQENPAYKFVNLAKGGTLIDAYHNVGPQKVKQIAQREMSSFFYNKNGKRHRITEKEYMRFKWRCSHHVVGLDDPRKVSDKELQASYVKDYFNKFTPHDACWDLNKRGGVGETPFHLLFLMDTPEHLVVAGILLELYPNLVLDVYESDEYYGESALHIAIVIQDLDSVKLLVEAGANINQRATGRFFLPEDQKNGYTEKTNYEGYAYYGEYPLAFAACMGNKDIYDYLLDKGANPDLQDSFGNTVLHMMVITDRKDMYKYAVRHDKHPASTIKNNQNLTPLNLACKLGKESIFKEILHSDSIEFWRFSTVTCSAHPLRTLDSIGPDGNTNWNSALLIIANGSKDAHLDMLEGGVMRQLLIEKWKTFAQRRFLIRLMFAIIHLALFSVAIYTRPTGSDLLAYREPKDAVRYFAEIAVCLSCLITVCYAVQEFCTQGIMSFVRNSPQQFFKAHAPAQVVYLVSCFLVLACIPCRFTGQYVVEDVLLILAAPCTWFFLLFFARGSSLTGPFVTMIYKMIVGDLFRFGIIYIIFLSGFTQGFYILFQSVSDNTDNTGFTKFSTLPETVISLFQMTLGEFKYEDFGLAHYSALIKIIFALFMILVPILLLNMLIAMMANTYALVISESTKQWWKEWAKIVLVLEWGISRKKLLAFQRSYSVKLTGPPAPGEGSHPPPEERALVVIRASSKSRAKERKEAVFRWKTIIKEILRQLRNKKDQELPFKLEKSLKKGLLLEQSHLSLLSNTVAQLAWEKDIDLNKGHALMSSNISLTSQSHFSVLSEGAQHLSNGSAMKRTGPQQIQFLDTEENVNEIALNYVKKRKTLMYNRVSPLVYPKFGKEEIAFSDTSDDVTFMNSESERGNLDFHYPSHVKAERQATNVSTSSYNHGSLRKGDITPHESHLKLVLSAVSVETDASSASETTQSVKRLASVPHQLTDSSRISSSMTEITNSSPQDKIAHRLFSSDTFEVQDTEFSITALSERASAATCVTEDDSNNATTRKRSKRKDKKKMHYKGRRKGKVTLNGSSSSVVTLLENPGNSRDSNV